MEKIKLLLWGFPICGRTMRDWLKVRLLHNLSCWAVRLSVRYETWPLIGWHRYFLIGWTKYRLGLPQSQWIMGARDRSLGLPPFFQKSLSVPLSRHFVYRNGCAKRLWNSVFYMTVVSLYVTIVYIYICRIRHLHLWLPNYLVLANTGTRANTLKQVLARNRIEWLLSRRGTEEHLTHEGRDKMAAILQTRFWDVFSWMKSSVSWFEFPWSLFLRVQLTISQCWFR